MTPSGTSEDVLRRAKLFGSLDNEALGRLARYCRRRTDKAKTHIFHEGDISQALFVIISGVVNIQQTKSDETIHIARRGPGEVIGELSVIEELPRSADAVAETECQLLILDRVDMKRFLAEHPDAAWQLIKTLSARLREATSKLVQTGTADALGKVAGVLLAEAQENKADEKGHIALPKFSDEKIAQRTGITRETVNRRISNLRETGVVRRDQRTLVIINLNKLRALAESK